MTRLDRLQTLRLALRERWHDAVLRHAWKRAGITVIRLDKITRELWREQAAAEARVVMR